MTLQTRDGVEGAGEEDTLGDADGGEAAQGVH